MVVKGCRGRYNRAPDFRRHFGGSPSPPRPTEPKQPPKETDKEVQEAQAEALRRRQMARGYRSTVMAKRMMTDDSYTKALAKTFGS
jgi:hypothetical protein